MRMQVTARTLLGLLGEGVVGVEGVGDVPSGGQQQDLLPPRVIVQEACSFVMYMTRAHIHTA